MHLKHIYRFYISDLLIRVYLDGAESRLVFWEKSPESSPSLVIKCMMINLMIGLFALFSAVLYVFHSFPADLKRIVIVNIDSNHSGVWRTGYYTRFTGHTFSIPYPISTFYHHAPPLWYLQKSRQLLLWTASLKIGIIQSPEEVAMGLRISDARFWVHLDSHSGSDSRKLCFKLHSKHEYNMQPFQQKNLCGDDCIFGRVYDLVCQAHSH